MRWWLRGSVIAFAFASAAAAMFPLRTALDAAPTPTNISVGDVSGTIWSGRLRDVAWGNFFLGDFEVSLPLLDLLPSPGIRLTNGSRALKTAMMRGDGDGDGFAISEAIVRLALADLVAGAPPDVSASITNGAVSLQGGRCTHAAGRIESPPVLAVGLPAFDGALACDRGVFLAHLTSEIGDIVLEISPALDRVAYRSASPALQPALAALNIAAVKPAI